MESEKKEYAAHISKAAMETGKAKRTHKSVHCTQKMERSEKKITQPLFETISSSQWLAVFLLRFYAFQFDSDSLHTPIHFYEYKQSLREFLSNTWNVKRARSAHRETWSRFSSSPLVVVAVRRVCLCVCVSRVFARMNQIFTNW